MKEEVLIVKTRKNKYNSYKGEITPAVPNEVDRNFHSDKPGELLLSDISEFAIPAGKVYLSPAVDCFDGLLVAWRIGKHPNADLVNGMLDDVIAILKNDQVADIEAENKECSGEMLDYIHLTKTASLIIAATRGTKGSIGSLARRYQ